MLSQSVLYLSLVFGRIDNPEQTVYGKCPKISNTEVSYKMAYANSAEQLQSDQVLHSLPFH